MRNIGRDLVQQAEHHGARIEVKADGNLRIKLDGGFKIPSGLYEQIAVHKKEIVAWLTRAEVPYYDGAAQPAFIPPVAAPPKAVAAQQAQAAAVQRPSPRRLGEIAANAERVLLSAVIEEPGLLQKEYQEKTGLPYSQLNTAVMVLRARGVINFGENKFRNRRLYFYNTNIKKEKEGAPKMEPETKPAPVCGVDYEEITSMEEVPGTFTPLEKAVNDKKEEEAAGERLSVPQFAKKCGLSPWMIHEAIKKGELAFVWGPPLDPRRGERPQKFISIPAGEAWAATKKQSVPDYMPDDDAPPVEKGKRGPYKKRQKKKWRMTKARRAHIERLNKKAKRQKRGLLRRILWPFG